MMKTRTMAKPIVIIKIPRLSLGNDMHELGDIQEALETRWTDYHVLVMPTDINLDTVVEVFFDENFTETNFKELKAHLDATINSLEFDKRVLRRSKR